MDDRTSIFFKNPSYLGEYGHTSKFTGLPMSANHLISRHISETNVLCQQDYTRTRRPRDCKILTHGAKTPPQLRTIFPSACRIQAQPHT